MTELTNDQENVDVKKDWKAVNLTILYKPKSFYRHKFPLPADLQKELRLEGPHTLKLCPSFTP